MESGIKSRTNIVSSDGNSHQFRLLEAALLASMLVMLFIVVLPGILQARERARSTTCAERMRAMGSATLEYAETNQNQLPNNRRDPFVGWSTLLLPQLDQQGLFDRYDVAADWWEGDRSKNQSIGETRLSEYLCPSAPHGERWIKLKTPEGEEFRNAPTDYVGSAGVYWADNQVDSLFRGAMAFPGRFYGASGVTAGAAVRISDVLDGRSQTMFIVEMADKPNPWRAGKQANVGEEQQARGLVPVISFGNWIAPSWNHLRSHTNDGTRAFGPCAVNCSNGAGIYGFHERGANVLMVDGSVKHLRTGMAEEVLIALVSIADGELLSPTDY